MATNNLLEKYALFVAKVYKHTLLKKIQWKQTTDSNQFNATLDAKYLLTIKAFIEGPDEREYYFSLRDSTGENVFFLHSDQPDAPELILDDETISLLAFPLNNDKKSASLSNVLSSIYDNAREQALQIDEKISDASKLLDNLEDLPF